MSTSRKRQQDKLDIRWPSLLHEQRFTEMKMHKIRWIKQNKDRITNNKAKSKPDRYSQVFRALFR